MDRAVSGLESIRVDAVVGERRVARRDRVRDGGVHRGHRFGVISEVCADLREVGLARLRVGATGLVEREEILWVPREEGGE